MLRPLFNNVWGVPLHTLSSTWGESGLIRPEMNIREKIHHIIKVYEVGSQCREIEPGNIVVLPEHHGGSVVTVNLSDGSVQRRFCFKETEALALWEGALPGVLDETLALPQTF